MYVHEPYGLAYSGLHVGKWSVALVSLCKSDVLVHCTLLSTCKTL